MEVLTLVEGHTPEGMAAWRIITTGTIQILDRYPALVADHAGKYSQTRTRLAVDGPYLVVEYRDNTVFRHYGTDTEISGGSVICSRTQPP
jgi:hypothetical protein